MGLATEEKEKEATVAMGEKETAEMVERGKEALARERSDDIGSLVSIEPAWGIR